MQPKSTEIFFDIRAAFVYETTSGDLTLLYSANGDSWAGYLEAGDLTLHDNGAFSLDEVIEVVVAQKLYIDQGSEPCPLFAKLVLSEFVEIKKDALNRAAQVRTSYLSKSSDGES
jgi:hypothetical protein